MRIAIYVHCFYPNHFYGTEGYTLALAKNLQVLGHEPTVVSAIFAGEPRQEKLVEFYEYDGVPVYSIDKNCYMHRTIEETYEQPALRFVHERILRRITPDVVHVCHIMNHTTAILEVVAAMNLVTTATLTDFFGFCLNNKLEAADGDLCRGPSESRANCIACHIKASSLAPGADPNFRRLNHPLVRPVVSNWLAKHPRAKSVSSRLGFDPNHIIERPDRLHKAMQVYRSAVAPSTFLRDAYAANDFPAPLVLSHFGIEIDRRPKPPSPNPTEVRLALIGQIAPHKGVHILIDALRAAERSNLVLTIWGPANQDPAYYASLQEKATGLPVTFAGTFPSARTREILDEIDVLVLPSTWYENAPLILLQALATHTPVIVSDVLGMTEFVPSEAMGFRFPRGNVGALARILRRFGDDPELSRRLSATTRYEREPMAMVKDAEAVMLKAYEERAAHNVPASR